MENIINAMLKKYNVNSVEDKKNAMKEIIQEIVLCALSRTDFFSKAAFYGGTALRIFYGLDRFSEDLDFSLMIPDTNFDFTSYFPMIEKEMNAFGIKVNINAKEKNKDSDIKSAFIKLNTQEHILLFYSDENFAESIASNERIKIKFEIDINPPKGATFEHKYQLLPSPYEVNLYDKSSLFAGKIHAVLCRSWKDRIKGRDLYDYVFYISRDTKVNMNHLKERLVDSEILKSDDEFDIDILKEMLQERFDSINYESAKDDVRSFIKDKKSIEIWSADFFKQITEKLKCV